MQLICVSPTPALLIAATINTPPPPTQGLGHGTEAPSQQVLMKHTQCFRTHVTGQLRKVRQICTATSSSSLSIT
jgi:hypothetical protein